MEEEVEQLSISVNHAVENPRNLVWLQPTAANASGQR